MKYRWYERWPFIFVAACLFAVLIVIVVKNAGP